MKAVKLYHLAKKEGACPDGLKYLNDWIQKHPQGTACQFFKYMKKVMECERKKDAYAYTDVFCYSHWAFNRLIDWDPAIIESFNKCEDKLNFSAYDVINDFVSSAGNYYHRYIDILIATYKDAE